MLFEKVIPVGACTLAEKFAGEKNFMEKVRDEFASEIANIEELSDLEPEFGLVGIGDFFASFAKISRMAKK